MERAAYLLHDSKLKLADITDQVGYTSSSYFIRTFRAYVWHDADGVQEPFKGQKQ